MNRKPLIIILGEPFSTFNEILFKFYKSKLILSYKRPIVCIGSIDLLQKQMLKLKYNFKINEIVINDIKVSKLKNDFINIIDVKLKFKKIFDQISFKSNKYIKKCFDIGLYLLKKKLAYAMVNGPISKKHFLKKKYLGITEYLSKKTKVKKDGVMLIYNSNLSVSPVTTHVPINDVCKKLNSEKIINNVLEIDHFFKNTLKKKPFFAILGLNPHCETIKQYSEEESIIKPAIKKLLKKRINITGPFSADTFFSKNNIDKFDVVIGMYHDQVLTPIKTIYNFNAINITLGLPFIRVSPDHGTNNKMIGKNKSNPDSLFSIIKFFIKIK